MIFVKQRIFGECFPQLEMRHIVIIHIHLKKCNPPEKSLLITFSCLIFAQRSLRLVRSLISLLRVTVFRFNEQTAVLLVHLFNTAHTISTM